MKLPGVSCLLKELPSDEEFVGISSATRWRPVSGINRTRLVPKHKSPNPIIKGTHSGREAIRKEVTAGAINSATTDATCPSRNTLALEIVH